MTSGLSKGNELRHRRREADDDHEPRLRGNGPLGYECVCGENLSWLPKRHRVGGKPIPSTGVPYGTTHDNDCPGEGCADVPFTLSPRSETYWAS